MTQGLAPEEIDRWSKELDDLAAKSSGSTPENLSVRDRLLRRTLAGHIEVSLEDDRGPFKLRVRRRIPDRLLNDTIKTVGRMQEIANGAQAAPEEEERLSDKLARFLAFVCLDKELDYTFWREGWRYSSDVVAAIIKAIGDETAREFQAVQSFRT